MTVLDAFLSFAKRLPAEQLGPIEVVLATLMDSHDAANAYSTDELLELDRRLAEPKPQFADKTAIDDLLGRTRRA